MPIFRKSSHTMFSSYSRPGLRYITFMIRTCGDGTKFEPSPPKRPVIELHHQKKGLKTLSPADGSILRHAGTSDAGIHHWSTLRLFHPMVSVHLIFHTPLMANLYKFPISITNKSRWKCPMWQIYGMLPMVSRPKLHRDHREPHIMFQNWASFDLTYPINCRMGRFWPFEKAQSTLIFGPKCNLKISQTRW